MFNTCIRHKRIKGQYRHLNIVVAEIMTVDTETNIGLKDKVYIACYRQKYDICKFITDRIWEMERRMK